MHSMGSISARRTTMVRPVRSPCSPPSAAGAEAAGSRLTRWLGATGDSSSSQKAVIAVSTRPLSGMGSAITTSKADMRSDATNRSRSSPAS